MKIILKAASIFVIICFCFSAIFSGIVGSESSPIKNTRSELTLKVALKVDIKSRNILDSSDVWTSKILWRCYDTTLKEDPETDELMPYVAQCSGDQHGVLFGCDEWPKGSGIFDPHNVTVTYDFTKVKFHDGVQVTIDDILASYHIFALHPYWHTDFTCLMDANGDPNISNFTTTHWLWIEKVGESEDKLHAKLNFKLQEDFVRFYRWTLSLSILPQHVWEGTGCGIHEDFGKIIDEKGHGVPPSEGGFDINKALAWKIDKDSYVIGTGPFKFIKWEKDTYVELETYEEYLYKRPIIDGILFKIYEKTDDAINALERGDIDYIAWSIPSDYISDLMGVENIGLSSAAEPGFFYLAFNMRKKDFGYDEDGNDVGKPFRKAVAHCVDKKTIVTTLLQNFGMIADGPVSPAITLWFNDSLPTYPPDVEKAKSILDNAGIVDADGDGWRELPTLGDTQFDILTPPANYDPIRSAAGLMIATQMQAAGINVISKPTAFGEIVRRIDARDFNMYILRWSIGGTDPDYLYSFFYSGNAEVGQNYPGYTNAEFDKAILASRAEMSETKRVELIKRCQGILVDDLPYDVLYYRQNIEAYRADRFTNWTLQAGSLFNFWSLIYIHRPPVKRLSVSISAPSAVISGGTAEVTVTVKNQYQNPLEGAMVYLEIKNPVHTALTGTISPTDGTTNINGQFIAEFHAPQVPSYSEGGSNETIWITVTKVTKEGYIDPPSKTISIVVKSTQSKFLAVRITAEFDVLPSEGIMYLDIQVTDENNSRVDGAQVNISVEPVNAVLSHLNGTTIDGKIRFIFTAPKVDEDTPYLITVHAKKNGYEEGIQSIEIDVVGSTIVDKPPITSPDIFLILTVICIVSLIYGFVKKRRYQ